VALCLGYPLTRFSTFIQVQWDLKQQPNTVVVVKNYADMRQQPLTPAVQFTTTTTTATYTAAAERPQEVRTLIGTPLKEMPAPDRDCQPSVDLPKLVTLRLWRSTRPPIREAITILTQLSADRLTMLENQCRTWPDPIIAIVYVPLLRNASGDMPTIATYQNTTLDDVMRGMNSFHSFMEGTAMCALQMELVGQYINPTDPQAYPINSLRNRALAAAKTELVFMLDVDFVASPNLGLPSPGYRDPAAFQQLLDIAGRRTAIVLPAFEITNRRQDLTMAQNFARSLVIGELQLVI
jgi:Glycosyl-transferase for dystroglycan